jgi:hypothetical protein
LCERTCHASFSTLCAAVWCCQAGLTASTPSLDPKSPPHPSRLLPPSLSAGLYPLAAIKLQRPVSTAGPFRKFSRIQPRGLSPTLLGGEGVYQERHSITGVRRDLGGSCMRQVRHRLFRPTCLARIAGAVGIGTRGTSPKLTYCVLQSRHAHAWALHPRVRMLALQPVSSFGAVKDSAEVCVCVCVNTVAVSVSTSLPPHLC